MKYSILVNVLLSLLNIVTVKCNNTKYKLEKELLKHRVYSASTDKDKYVIKIVEDETEGELMKPGGRESLYIAKVLYNDECNDLTIDYNKISKKDLFEGSMCIVMPLYEGDILDLESHIMWGIQLNRDLSGIWISQVLMGLSILHENNIIHNDIKEDNVFIEKKGNALIADFGAGR
eukprot:GHVR01075572.1.p1 GENE.GHVR01075572.1~~GHVR01075572.1.p1  ORF type:complete len:176 (+),score=34.65 GHVR01075572.1:65-592(+)